METIDLPMIALMLLPVVIVGTGLAARRWHHTLLAVPMAVALMAIHKSGLGNVFEVAGWAIGVATMALAVYAIRGGVIKIWSSRSRLTPASYSMNERAERFESRNPMTEKIWIAVIISIAALATSVVIGGRYTIVQRDTSTFVLDRFTGSIRSCNTLECEELATLPKQK